MEILYKIAAALVALLLYGVIAMLQTPRTARAAEVWEPAATTRPSLNTTALGEARKTHPVIPAQAGIHTMCHMTPRYGFPSPIKAFEDRLCAGMTVVVFDPRESLTGLQTIAA